MFVTKVSSMWTWGLTEIDWKRTKTRLFSGNFITTTPSTGINVSNENPCSSPSTTTIKKFPSWEFNVYFNIVHFYLYFVVFVPVNDIIDFIPLKRPLELLCWVMLCYLWWMSGFANVCGIDTHKLNSIWLDDFQINFKKKPMLCDKSFIVRASCIMSQRRCKVVV